MCVLVGSVAVKNATVVPPSLWAKPRMFSGPGDAPGDRASCIYFLTTKVMLYNYTHNLRKKYCKNNETFLTCFVLLLGLCDYGKNHNHDYFWSIIDITIIKNDYPFT